MYVIVSIITEKKIDKIEYLFMMGKKIPNTLGLKENLLNIIKVLCEESIS